MTLTVHQASAWQWALVALLVSLVAALSGSVIVVVRFGRPRVVPRLLATRAAEGFGYAVGGSAQSIYNDVDKAMLSHYGLNVQNGIYTLAYRLIDISTIPITALDAAALPRYFRTSKSGLARLRTLSFQLARRGGLVGLVMAVCAFLAAPLVPHVMGYGFSEAVSVLRWLCFLPALRGLHQLTGSAITASGRQRYRTFAQFSAASLNVLLNLWLIPLYGWRGAAWATLVTDGSLVVTNWLILRSLKEVAAYVIDIPTSLQGSPAVATDKRN